MKASRIFYVLLVAAIAASFGAGYSLKKTQVIEVDVPRTVTDTLMVEVERVVYKHFPAKHDTAWVPLEKVLKDTVYLLDPASYASLDTMLEAGGQKYGQLSVLYYPRPDYFDIRFNPAPMPTIQITKYIDKKRRWYNNPLVTMMAGTIAGVAITQYTR